jgi:hypothetical protein
MGSRCCPFLPFLLLCTLAYIAIIMPKNALLFFNTIFSHKPAGHHILVWELNRQSDTKRNNFFDDIEQAAGYAAKQKPEGTDVYFCVSTLPKLKKGRGKLSDVLGIGSLHLDVDIQNSLAHKKQNLPATIDEAIDFVNGIDLKPSILINSGYGLHAYWLLKDFVQFDDTTRPYMAGLLESWQKMYKYRAGLQGYDVDATQDTTRVLRVPDTLNWKIPASPVQAKIISIEPDLRYTPAELASYLDLLRKETVTVSASPPVPNGKPKPAASNVPYNELQVTLDENATIDADTFEALSDNIPKFKLTWQRKRKDLQDQSGSSYDMALANMALAAGLDDQTTVNLLISHRRKHGDEKPRLDYYQRTLAEARSVMYSHRERAQAANNPYDPADKDSVRADLRTLLGFDIVKIEKQLTEPPAFIVHFPGGKVKNMGDARGLIDQHLFRNHVANTIGKVVKQMKVPLWESAAQKMLDLAEDIEISDEATEVGELREILSAYITEHLLTNSTEKQHRAVAARHQPAVINNMVCVHALELWKYAKRNFGYKQEKKHLIGLLKRLDAPREVFNVRDDRDKQHSVSVYCLPPEWLPANAVRAELDADADDVEYAGKL